VVVVAAAVAVVIGRHGGGGGPAAAGQTGPPAADPAGDRHPAAPLALRVTRIAELPAAAQDPAVATLGNRAYAFGGLDSSGGSTSAILVVRGSTVRPEGALPVPVHDAAAAPSGRHLLVLGGGQVASFAGIGAFDPSTRRLRLVGSLPTPLSDLAAVTIGSTTYVVGGYTGSAWSNRVLAIRGHTIRTVARLPVPLRYAAAAAQGGDLVIAGGRTPTGPSRAIYRFSAGSGLHRIGSLPQPLMHAGAGTLGGAVYVVGGLAADGRPVRSVLAIGRDGSAHRAASLPAPLSDAGVASLPGRLLVIGGNAGSGPVRSVLQIAAGSPSSSRPGGMRTPVLPAMFRGPLPGDLLIADRGNNRLLIINPAKHILWRYPSRPGQPRLNFDDDAFFTPGGRAIISNEEENHDIVKISYPGGRLFWRYGHPGQPGSAPGFLNTPDDAYQLKGGLVISSDDKNCRIVEIRGHRLVRSIGRPGACVHDPPHSFASPNGDTPLPNGDILVSEIGGSWIDEITRSGGLVHSFQAPVSYPSDPQLTRTGNILVSDYSFPGGVVILQRRTGRVLWRYQPASGPGELDHPSLATMLPNGDVLVGDDYNDRIVIINRASKRIVWQYGRKGVAGTRPGLLNIPDGFDFIPVSRSGSPDPAAIHHGP